MRFLLVFFFAVNLYCYDREELKRRSSYPYISGNTFRAIADHILDYNAHPNLHDDKCYDYHPLEVKRGDIVFVCGDLLEKHFKNYHPHIMFPYVLVTHNSDVTIPGDYAKFLEDPKLLMWFGQNLENFRHPKIKAIPIGLANNHWRWGNTKIIEGFLGLEKQKKYLLYVNFMIQTNYKERAKEMQWFSRRKFAYASPKKPYPEYIQDLFFSRFVLSPRGNGLDCHRTWEALLVGSIPIVKPTTNDDLYEGLPLLFIEDWYQISEQFLLEKEKAILNRPFEKKRLFADYWIQQIKAVKKNETVSSS